MNYTIILEPGQVYECTISQDAGTRLSGQCLHTNNENRMLFEYIFCWRGVWEGRLYFKDSEYWSEDLEVMHRIWIILENKLKEIIRDADPDIKKYE
jgi:hypothetical protein